MSDMKIAGLFPGQGSQSVGMGMDWFEKSSEAKDIFNSADKTLGFSISDLCFKGPAEELTLTKYAQPALLLVSYISYKLSEIQINVTAGHSLGEYTALVVSNVLSFEDALNLVHKRGIYMQEAVPVGEGSMAAVMGLSEEEILTHIKESDISGVEIANLNSPGQMVLAGSKDSVTNFSSYLKDKGSKVIPLNVSAPFHSSLMKPAAESLARDLDAVNFNDPEIPVYANVNAQKISSGSEARELLKQQVCGTVRWTDEIVNLHENEKITHTVEFGPGGVLSKLLKRTIPSITRLEVFNPETATAAKEKL